MTSLNIMMWWRGVGVERWEVPETKNLSQEQKMVHQRVCVNFALGGSGRSDPQEELSRHLQEPFPGLCPSLCCLPSFLSPWYLLEYMCPCAVHRTEKGNIPIHLSLLLCVCMCVLVCSHVCRHTCMFWYTLTLGLPQSLSTL